MTCPIHVMSVLLVALTLGLSSDDIFHQYLTKQVLLDLLDIAERELKIFIYPIPEYVDAYKPEGKPSDWQECTGRTFELHFCIEEIFVRYLQDIEDNFEDYPHVKTKFMTQDADQANAFIIDHTWVMKNSVENHLRPIINNVVDNYPFYNRSYGHDHFLIYPYDFGVLCSGRHLREDWSEIDDCPVDEKTGHKYFCHVSRIINTSFIGNYGMDAKYYDDNEYSFGLKKCIGDCPKVVCHRPQIDIVTPQYLTANTHACYTDLARNKSLYVKKDIDSCFKGNYRNQRSILKLMKNNALFHFRYNQTERYLETDDLQKCIFAYHMCGEACWSQRLYDALALGAIPIIVADGAIQAFERYLDWRKFSIKISVAELFQDRFTYRFRRGLRRQADIFRKNIKQMQLNVPSEDLLSYQYPKSTDVATIGSLSSSPSSPLKYTVTEKKKMKKQFGLVLAKMINVRASVEWFNFRDVKLEVNAFRMMVLEMFCRQVRRRKPPNDQNDGSSHDVVHGSPLMKEFDRMNPSHLALDKRFQYFICSRRSDFISRLRYVR